MRLSLYLTALFSAAVLLTGCASSPERAAGEPAEEGRVHARLVAGESALPGAEITAVMNPGIEFRERVHTSVAGEDATALLSLPPGSWYLSARSAEGSVFGFYGPNPVQIRSGEEVPVSIRGLAGNRPPSVETADGKGGIEGRVATTGGPLEGAVVAFYLDASSQFRGPGYVEVTTDRDGLFFSSVSPGRYFLVVRKRSGSGGGFGPLSVGDHFGYYGFNPVVLRERERIDLQMAAVEVLRRTGWEKPSALRALLSGVVRDPGYADTYPEARGVSPCVRERPSDPPDVAAERAGVGGHRHPAGAELDDPREVCLRGRQSQP